MLDTSYLNTSLRSLRDIITNLQIGQTAANAVASAESIDDDAGMLALELAETLDDIIASLEEGADALESIA